MSIKYALERNGGGQLQEEILANTYIDNVLIGAKTVEEGYALFDGHEFMSNNKEVVQSIPEEDRMKKTRSTVELLRIRWDTDSDTLTVPVKTTMKEDTSKRTALKSFACTFAPLGLLTPLFIKAKMFIQDLWVNKYSWDDPFDESTVAKWKSITEGKEGFVGNVPRFITVTGKVLVVFSDASQSVYAALCRSAKGEPFSNVIFSKATLADMKKTAIPQLELLGSVSTAELVRFLRKHLQVPLNSVQILSDSQIALYWIHSNKQLKTFVNNRVKIIEELHSGIKAKMGGRANTPTPGSLACVADDNDHCRRHKSSRNRSPSGTLLRRTPSTPRSHGQTSPNNA
ncbi:Pao retrotransposon peptidase [Ostertagia ostertagi]